MHIYERTLNIWGRFFARPRCRPLNNLLVRLGCRGLGIGNFGATEKVEENFFRSIVARKLSTRPTSIVFDVGANDGHYSKMVRRFLPTATIHAFEPHPATFLRLTKNTDRMEIECHRFGLGAFNGRATLWDYANCPTGSEHATLYPATVEHMTGASFQPLPIELRTLDTVSQELGITYIDFLKLDIEGNELSCLSGAERLLKAKSVGMIQFEFNSMNLDARVTMTEFFKLLAGYRLWRLLPKGMIELRRSDPLLCNLFGYQNIAALPINREAPALGS